MNSYPSPQVWRKLSVIIVLTFGLLVANCERPPKVLEVVVWHTELDPDAEKLILKIAGEVTREFSSRWSGYTPVISVSGLAWGDLATRLFQESASPPDLTHLEPFMVYQVLKGYSDPAGFSLYPLDPLISRLVHDNGAIKEAVRSLHSYPLRPGAPPATVGIAYAVGTTYVAYRRDWSAGTSVEPSTWEELVAFADKLAAEGSRLTGRKVAPFILPGKDPFFVDQLTNEMLVSIGGSLYNSDKPNLDTPEMRRVLWVLQDMIARTAGGYGNTTYRQQFDMFGDGLGAVVPVTYGRATKQIDAILERQSSPEQAKQMRLSFSVMRQPGASPGSTGVATIDAEPWVIIARPEHDPERAMRVAIAERFLELFFERQRYLAFCKTVPVHLRPIFGSLDADYDSAPMQRAWSHWVEVGKDMLSRPGGTAPILMDPGGGASRSVAFALSLQRNAVLSDMVLQAYQEAKDAIGTGGVGVQESERVVRERAIEAAIRRGAARAAAIWKEAG